MKTDTEIRERVRGLLVQELDRRVDEAHRRLPRRCTFNHRQVLDTRKAVDGEPNENFNRLASLRHLPMVPTIGLCMYGAEDPEQWNGAICEDPIDAQKCPLFVPRQTKKQLLEEFQEQLATEGWVQENMPDVAVLLWALDAAEATWVRLPWWTYLWYRFILRIQIEPVCNVPDSSQLLKDLLGAPDSNQLEGPPSK